MKKIDDLLGRFYKSLLGSERTKEVVVGVIQEIAGVGVEKEKVFYRDGVLKLEISPVAKNQIKIKEEAILRRLQEAHSIRVGRVLYL
jgi:hypothetical protein